MTVCLAAWSAAILLERKFASAKAAVKGLRVLSTASIARQRQNRDRQARGLL